jgi:CheY-like chemotaxis protein
MAQLPAKSPCVLIVDSSAEERELYAECLRRVGMIVLEADTPEEALTKASNTTVVVTELRLHQREDGLELIRHLRRDDATRNAPIIVLTAAAMQADRDKALSAGCDAFIAMPCLPAELVTVLRYLIERVPGLRLWMDRNRSRLLRVEQDALYWRSDHRLSRARSIRSRERSTLFADDFAGRHRKVGSRTPR